MEYFYTPPSCITGNELRIEGDELTHVERVLRKKAGDVVHVTDGAGTVYTVTLIEVRKHSARCRITDRHPGLHEPSRDVMLGVALLKNPSRYDMLVEKGTELGVNAFVPLLTERTVQQHARSNRWHSIALSAMKQSCRCWLPTVAEATPLAEFVRSAPASAVRIILHEKSGGVDLRLIDHAAARSVILCIGPEGGFSEQEIALAVEGGFEQASLGERRLRTETAALAASALLL